MNTNPRPTLVIASMAAVLLVACAAPSGSGPSADPGGSEPGEPMPSLPAGDVPDDLLEEIVADAAEGAGVPVGDVSIVTAEAVTWSDGSLGCPQPDQMYTQALVPGYRVVVEIDGEELHFHASETGEFRHCDDPQPPVDDGTVDR